MEKVNFYRKTDNGFIKDCGYNFTVITPEKSIDFIISRCGNGYDITHAASGFLASVQTYKTIKAAKEQLSAPDYIAAIIRLENTARVKAAVATLPKT